MAYRVRIADKDAVNSMILTAMQDMYDSGVTPPFYMSDVQKYIWEKQGGSWGEGVRDVGWTDRMQRHCARLAKNGKLIILKRGSRYYLALPNGEFDNDYQIIGHDDIPDHKAYRRQAMAKKFLLENQDIMNDMKDIHEKQRLDYDYFNARGDIDSAAKTYDTKNSDIEKVGKIYSNLIKEFEKENDVNFRSNSDIYKAATKILEEERK